VTRALLCCIALAARLAAQTSTVPGSGLNGMGSRIRLRGLQSLVDDPAPLVLVDGMRVDGAEDDFSTGYSGGDPEPGSYGVLQFGSPRTIADLATLPLPRTWTLRLDLAY
jgi:hypothetical protein